MGEHEASSTITARREHRQSERLDNFVDAAFAFAITLLVISGASLPRSVDALVHALYGVPAFAVCFAQLAWFWHGHVSWREISGRTDGAGLCLSLLLVFFALIFVFPLHLVYASFFHSLSGGVLSPDFSLGADPLQLRSMKLLFACFGLSFACMGGTLATLFAHSARTASGLPRGGAVGAWLSSVMWAYIAAVGFVSMLIALFAGAVWVVAVAGYSYTLLALTGVVVDAFRRRFRRRET